MSYTQDNAMDEVIPGLWIGGIRAVGDVESLRKHNIYSVLSAMRGRVKVAETFTHFQIQLDDTEDSDALAFFPQCISFIENELDNGRGVLVHCQAGMSRSATIVAAYLMYARRLNAQEALDLIREARPQTEPNEGFLAQLDVFYEASYKITRKNKIMRMYYLERALEEIMNGPGILSATSSNMLANFPRSPSDSVPATPGGSLNYTTAPLPPRGPRRRIRCKMCRTELAAREHMLDHGQVGAPTPAANIGLSPVTSRRPSTNLHDRPVGIALTPLTPLQAISRRNSSSGDRALAMAPLATLNGEPVQVPVRRFSIGKSQPGSAGPVSRTASFNLSTVPESARRPSFLSREISGLTITGGGMDVLDDSAIDDEDDDEEIDDATKPAAEATDPPSTDAGANNTSTQTRTLSRRRSGKLSSFGAAGVPFMTPMDLAAQLNHHPKLAALRTPSIGAIGGLQPMSAIVPNAARASEPGTPHTPNGVVSKTNSAPGEGSEGTPTGPASAMARMAAVTQVPPLINNNTCSGYFVEPMKWMEPFLENGELAGKIICPNSKCGAKLGSYDWAGVCCSCKEWVTPGFCIHRSKVDEIIV